VGSNTAGEYIHARGSANGKRVQANLGAKNHGVIMPGKDLFITCTITLQYVLLVML
jgi:malonate-semialdehyde dehydrogenase (acetylating) / methylmalonate-semialdehyde dehydrogenase